MKEITRICPYCLKEFKTNQWNKTFCKLDHTSKYNNLKFKKKATEKFKLSDYEQEIWERIHNDN